MEKQHLINPHRDSNLTNTSRREFIFKAATGLVLAAGAVTIPFQHKPGEGKIKAVAFDAFAIFDPRPVFALAEKLYPGKGKEIAETWRVKQFEYTWLRVAGEQYKNFMDITGDALLFATRKAQVNISEADKSTLVNAYSTLEVWTDVLPILQFLKNKGIRLAFLSNMTEKMLESCIHQNRLSEYFELVLSTDQQKTYKPSPRSYQIGPDNFHLNKSEILFVAFAGWDAAGAKWFGYQTYWVNRLDAPAEELDVRPDHTGKSLEGIRKLV